MKNRRGITLVALVITVIILLILAGITMYLLGEQGIIKRAEQAGREYKQAEVNESKDLDDIFSSIRVAEDSKVTLTMEELDKYINQKVDERLGDTLNRVQPTGIRQDTYINGVSTDTTKYSATKLKCSNDPNNNIQEYLSYSETDGYTVKKAGWYFMAMDACEWEGETVIGFILNNKELVRIDTYNTSGSGGTQDSFSIYLKQGDKFYFNIMTQKVATSRRASVSCWPMF